MDKQKIINFLKTLCPAGKVEFNDLSKVFGFEEALTRNTNVYFLASVKDNNKRNKDSDIVFKNYFYVDFDIRKGFFDKNNGEILTDENMGIYLEYIKERLKTNGYGDWRYIVFTGNGYHFYYVGVGNNYSTEDYKTVIDMYYNKIDEIFENDPIFKTDKACKNIGRIARLPGTMNYGRQDKYLLDIKACEIIEETEIISKKIEAIPELAKIEKEKNYTDSIKEEAKREIKRNMCNVHDDSDEVLDIILSVDIVPLVEDFTGLKLGKDKKNFPDKDGNTGMFTADNLLYWMGTGRVDGKYKGYNTFLFVRENYNLDNNQTFQRFKDRYNTIKDISDKKKKEYVAQKKLETKIVPISNQNIWIEKETIDWNFDGYKPSRGLNYLDKEFRKMDENGELIVLFGPPGSGKTEFSFFVARGNEMGLKTVYFCLELSEDTILKRWSLRKNGLSWEDVDFGRLEQYQKDNCVKHVNKFKNDTKDYLKMISISQQPTLDQLLQKMEQERNGDMLFIIDNLGKIAGDDNENVRFAEITAKLQTYAYNNRCWIVLQHHTTKPPTPKTMQNISDVFESSLFGPYGFRGSQKIYDNATRMIEIHRDYSQNTTKLFQYKHSPTDTRGMGELLFDKGEYSEYVY